MTSTGQVFATRLSGAVLASAAFGLIAAQVPAGGSLPVAIGLGFLFGTSFIGGTGYRIIAAVLSGRQGHAPASWSGASAGATLFALALWVVMLLLKLPAAPVLLGFGVGINIAYLLAKTACISAGCCHAAPDRIRADLRLVEIGATVSTLVLTALMFVIAPGFAGAVAIAGHLIIRLLSRGLRGRWSWGWPPLRQPGAEIAPLALAMLVSLLPV